MGEYNYRYGNDTIRISYFLCFCKLFVNGQLQDKGAVWSTKTMFQGKLNSGEEIKLSFEGSKYVVSPRLFVGDRLLGPNTRYPTEKEKKN